MTVTARTDSISDSKPLNSDTVPLGTGPPTREELLVYYPAKFTFQQLKTFINSGCAHNFAAKVFCRFTSSQGPRLVKT